MECSAIGLSAITLFLRTVRIFPRVGHGQEEWFIMFPWESFILKLFAIYRHAARSIASRKVTALNHKSSDSSALIYIIQ